MDRIRTSAHRTLSLALAGLICCAASGGCAGGLAGLMWLAKGTNAPAEFKGLQKKKVAVVCRVPPSLEYRSGAAGNELATRVGELLKANVKKIELVDQREVDRYMDENMWDDPRDVGKAVSADMVVAIDLEQFSLYEGPTLFRGKADLLVKVYDLKEDGKVVYEDFPSQIVYPPNTGVPTTERQPPQFQREFIKVVADRLAKKYYDHDSTLGFASDSLAFQ